MLKGIVIAGNASQYDQWLKHKGFKKDEYRYASSVEKVAGVHHSIVYLTGEYWKNPIYGTTWYDYLMVDNQVVEDKI